MPEDLWSSEATLVVREPQGVDAAAWAWLRAQPGGWKRQKWSDDLGRGLIEAFPSSDYARFGIGMLTRLPQDPEPWLRTAIELSQDTWLADFYRLRLEGRQSTYRCDEPPFAASRSARAEYRACILRVKIDASSKIRSISSKTSSPAVRHLADVVLRRMQSEVDDIREVKE